MEPHGTMLQFLPCSERPRDRGSHCLLRQKSRAVAFFALLHSGRRFLGCQGVPEARFHRHTSGNSRSGAQSCRLNDSSCPASALNPGYTGLLAVLAILLVLECFARAQEQAPGYPTRMIRLLQGFPPGGNVEFVARLLAHEMSKTLGATVFVEARPGQAGSLAAEAVASAEPDGYTLLVVSGAHPATAAVYKRLKYDPLDGLAWISTAPFYPFLTC